MMSVKRHFWHVHPPSKWQVWYDQSGQVCSCVESQESIGSFKCQGAWSQWRYLANIFETSAQPLRCETKESISRFESLPTIVRRIPNSSSRQLVPSNIIQNEPSGSSTLALAMQKKTFLIICMRSRYRLVGINIFPVANLNSTRARWAVALRCSSCSESNRSTHRKGKMKW